MTGRAPPRARTRLLRQLPLEEPEHLGHQQHLQLHPLEHRLELHGGQRMRVRRLVFGVGLLRALHRLRHTPGPGQQPERGLHQQHLQRSFRVRLHVPGRHRELVQWSGGYNDPNSNASIKAQDAGSTFNGSVTAPTTTTTTTGGTGTTTTTTTTTGGTGTTGQRSDDLGLCLAGRRRTANHAVGSCGCFEFGWQNADWHGVLYAQ